MTYQFPDSLIPLRNWLRSQGLTDDSIKTSRQAAFMAQQLLGSRVKFPPQGSDMMSTLLLIQKQIPGGKPMIAKPAPTGDLFGKAPEKKGKGKKGKLQKARPAHLSAFAPEVIATGYHVFADGARYRTRALVDGASSPIGTARRYIRIAGARRKLRTTRWSSRPSCGQ